MKENTLYLIYLNEWDMATAAFTLQCSEARVMWLFMVPEWTHFSNSLLISICISIKQHFWIDRTGSTLLPKRNTSIQDWNKAHHLIVTIFDITVRKHWASENRHWIAQWEAVYLVWIIATGKNTCSIDNTLLLCHSESFGMKDCRHIIKYNMYTKMNISRFMCVGIIHYKTGIFTGYQLESFRNVNISW